MSNEYYVVGKDKLTEIADAIRTKGGTSAQLVFPDGWKTAISNIETGVDVPVFTMLDIFNEDQYVGTDTTCNKTYEECAEMRSTGKYEAIAVFGSGETSSEETHIMSTQGIMASLGLHDGTLVYYGTSLTGVPKYKITYASNGTITYYKETDVLETLNVNSNGEYIAPFNRVYDEVIVDVPSTTPVIEPLTITENGTYTAPSGIDGYSPITVNVSSGSGDVWQDENGLVHLASEASGGDEVPDDGKTRIWIHIAEGTPDNRLTFYLRFTASTANNTTVDWGDGTTETLGSTTATNYSHKYPSGGDYVITMTVNSGTISFEGTGGNGGYSIYGLRESSTSSSYYNRIRIKRIIFGDDITSVGDYVCYLCYSLASVTILDGATNIGGYAFSTCYSLASLTIPDGVTSIGDYAFSQCHGLASLTIPDSVTSIGKYTFAYCYGMSEYHFKPTTPPTLVNATSFQNIPSDCIIYVPQGSLSAYQQATNWSQYSSHMQEEPQS